MYKKPEETSDSEPPISTSEEFIHISVSGVEYITMKDTLEEFPGTLLGNEERRRRYFVKSLNAYFFDRNRDCFEAILYYYQSGGTLFRPTHIPMDVFVQEARFFGLSEDVLSNLYKLEGYIQTVEEDDTDDSLKNGFQKKVWILLDSPDSSFLARIIGFLSISIITISIFTFCLETVPQYHNTMYIGQHPRRANSSYNNASQPNTDAQRVIQAINVVEVISIAWFSMEYLLRFSFSPNKWLFMKSFLNFIDLVAILPFFIVMLVKSEAGSSLAVVRVARLTRVFRIFKLSRHSMGLQILGNTLKASMKELFMMLCVICFSIVMFSSAIYYAEHEGGGDSMFKSIPSAFWYTLVTMTTVGYGDNVPLTIPGKMIGGFCAITGVLMIAMVIPIIVTNFEFFYKRDRINTAHQEQKIMSMKHSARKNGQVIAEHQLLTSNI